MSRLNKCILLIDDNPAHARSCQDAAAAGREDPWHVECVTTLEAGLERLGRQDVWVTFFNLAWSQGPGLDGLDQLLSIAATSPVVVLGGAGDDAMCRAAMQRGARDYLLEGHIDLDGFARALRYASERDLVRQELYIEKERAQVTLNSIGDAVLSTDVSGNVSYMNVVAEHMTGWPSLEAVGRPLTDVFKIIDSVTRRASPNPMELAVQLDKPVGLSANCILVRRDGAESAIEDSAAPIHDRDGQITGAVIVFHDVSMAREMVAEMSHLARHDALTNLPNRLLLMDRLNQAMVMARRNHQHLAVLYVDLDGFKRINDSLGHACGDLLLNAVATRLTACVRKSDTVSRHGGDEFVILLPEVRHAADAAITAAKIIAALRRPYHIGDQRLHVTVSMGISTYPEGGDDAETLIKSADAAMYHAKERGRDGMQFFDRNMNAIAVERQSLEGQLRYAIDAGELRLHYQPKINLETGAITSVEALVRWQHAERGLLMPGQFLTVAEECGMIVPIGRWVLQEACRQTREWLDAGVAAVPVAVNISCLEFGNDQFLEGVQSALKAARLEARYLEIELTESVLMRHAESTAHALEELKSIGVRLAIDDFGTGYSSLSYLTRFPVDALKLDQSFVHDIGPGSDGAILVSSVIGMGKGLRHRVIAEGVETPEQLAFLRAQGCDEGQGYYFSRPIVAHEFAQLLATGITTGITGGTSAVVH